MNGKIKVTVSNIPLNRFEQLDSSECPEDGVYRIVSSTDGSSPSNAIIMDGLVIFFDTDGIQNGIYEHQNLDYSYTLEPCNCTIDYS